MVALRMTLGISEAVGLVPRLKFGACVRVEVDRVVVELDDDEIEIVGLPPPSCCRALAEMQGDRDLAAIAGASGCSVHEIHHLCRRLAAEGALEFVSLADAELARRTIVEPSLLVDACAAYFPEWKKRLFSHPLWVALANGTAPKAMFIGWMIESFHFIEGATARLPIAISNSSDPVVRKIFAKHFSEEYDHHHFFARALAAAGLDATWLKNVEPLPGTNAVRNHMRACGRRDPLAYAACSGFLESTGSDHARSRAFFSHLAAHFDNSDASIIKPIADHARLDEGYQHCGFLGLVADAIGPVTRSRAEEAFQSAFLLLETLEVWSTDIQRHYRGVEALTAGLRRYRPLTGANFGHG